VAADTPAFFSYCREDSDFALRLAEDLKAAGAKVWIDQLDIEPGLPWDREVEAALAACARMLVILSPVSVKSDNVRDEVSFALSKQKRLIPVLYRECDVPFRLARLQHIDFRADYARGLKALLRALGVEPPAVASAAAAAGPPAESNLDVVQADETATAAGQKPPKEDKRPGRGPWMTREEIEQARLAKERKLAEEARLEQERKAAAEQARLAEERKQAAEQALLAQQPKEAEQPPVEQKRKWPFSSIAPRVRWLKKNWKWALPAWLVLFGSVMGLVLYILGNSEITKLAFAQAQSNAGVVQRLGEPIKRGWFIEGNEETSGASGKADLSIPLSGPKGKGTLYVVANRSGGEWKFETLQVKVEGDNQRIDLLQGLTAVTSQPSSAAELPSRNHEAGSPAKTLTGRETPSIQSQENVTPKPVAGQLGWAVGENDTVLRTEDGGRTWRPHSGAFRQHGGTHFYTQLIAAAFVTPQSGWAVGNYGIIHTEDGGRTWQKQSSGSNAILNSVTFVTPQSGWAVGYLGAILHTTNGGRTWQKQNSGGTVDLFYAVTFITPQSGWAAGSDGIILHTDDGGRIWQKQSSGTGEHLSSVAFVTPQSGWAVGGNGIILHTEDGGRTWQRQSSGTQLFLSSVAFVTPQSGWAAGQKGAILHTEDGGRTWQQQSSGTDLGLSSITFATRESGWAAGQKGTILHTVDGGRTWQQQKSGTTDGLYSITFARP
jgi:photosystem II stability/assembly factor-like uncharacterized protein